MKGDGGSRAPIRGRRVAEQVVGEERNPVVRAPLGGEERVADARRRGAPEELDERPAEIQRRRVPPARGDDRDRPLVRHAQQLLPDRVGHRVIERGGIAGETDDDGKSGSLRELIEVVEREEVVVLLEVGRSGAPDVPAPVTVEESTSAGPLLNAFFRFSVFSRLSFCSVVG